MKKIKLFMMGMLAMMLAFGLVLAGCDNDPDNGPSHDPALVGKWYGSQDAADADGTTGLVCEFKDNGELSYLNMEATWTTSGGTITVGTDDPNAGFTLVGTVSYSVSGTILTLSNGTGYLQAASGSTLYKKAAN